VVYNVYILSYLFFFCLPDTTYGLLRNRDAHTHEPPSILTLETQVLSLEMSSLGVFGNLVHGVCTPLALRQGIVNRLSIRWGNSILLSKVSLLYDRIGKLSSAPLLSRDRDRGKGERPTARSLAVLLCR